MSVDDVLVDVKNLWRKFPRDMDHARRYGVHQVARSLLGKTRHDDDLLPGEFWALQDVSLQLHRGESVAILGLNGAGKSTLLKVIAGLQLPHRGSVTVRGTLDSLIELSTGFHPNLSGRENIFIRGAFNGMSRRETAMLFDEIVEFAELEEFIDMPVRNYSSGMFARLGFASAIVGSPDILLVDEILSVGDFTFRQKCLDRMNELKRRSAVLFVSHSFGTVRMFCDRGIVLDHSLKVFEGSATEAIDHLMKLRENSDPETESGPTDDGDRPPAYHPVRGATYRNPKRIADVSCVWLDEKNNHTLKLVRDDRIVLEFGFQLLGEASKLEIDVPIWNSNDELVTVFSTRHDAEHIRPDSNGWVYGQLEIDPALNPGTYHAVLGIQDEGQQIFRDHLAPLEILGEHPRLFGSVRLNHEWIQDDRESDT